MVGVYCLSGDVMRAKQATKTEAILREALRLMVEGYEADCMCRKVKPNDIMKNHTWLALAYSEAKSLLGKAP